MSTECKENRGVPQLCRVIDWNEYAALRAELRELKAEAAAAKGSKAGQRLESALVRAAREEGAAREAELQGELAAAQAAARDQLEKAARQRRMHERERKALQGRADELAAQLEHAAQRHAAELTALRQEQEAAQRAAAADLGRQQRVLDAELARLAAEAEARGAALERQCQSAVAVQTARASQQQQELEAAHAALQRRCNALERALGDAGAQLHAAHAAEAGSQARLADVQRGAAEAVAAAVAQAEAAAVAVAEERRRVAQVQEEAAAAEDLAGAALAAIRERKAAELEGLHARFLGLLATKDATIQALRRQVAEVGEQLAALL